MSNVTPLVHEVWEPWNAQEEARYQKLVERRTAHYTAINNNLFDTLGDLKFTYVDRAEMAEALTKHADKLVAALKPFCKEQ